MPSPPALNNYTATLNNYTATPLRVCILGASLDVGNRGVRALGVSVAQLVNTTYPGVELVFHYGNATGGSRRLASSSETLDVQVRNCRMSPRSAPCEHILMILVLAGLYRCGVRGPATRNPWLQSLLSADLIGEIRGGDSFSDIYGFRRFVLGCLPLVSVALLGRPYAMLPQTYGPFRWGASRLLARALLGRATTLFTRDRNCVSDVVRLCGRTPRFCSDVAFTLEAIEPCPVPVKPGGLDLNVSDCVVGVNVSGLLYTGGYTGRNMFGLRADYPKLIDELLEGMLDSTQAKILLVPHEFGSESEEEACAAILTSFGSRYPGRVFVVDRPLSERGIKWVIGRTQFFIGSRMHACIAALSQCVPAVGLAYSDKFLGVFESAGVGDATIDLRETEMADVVTQVLFAFERRVERREQLIARIPALKREIRQTFGELMRCVTSD